ncbi:DNA repair protein RecN [Odoribacter lunatus]|uniref:DNA repair protein RecN n=1 Tax=Odoribacter lunatus TaxID=2941335 RepID=UPI002041D7D8|nr:DNA repair protein RecN [Odoribacter lunatus]
MIENISVRNYALIDKTDIVLEKGFTVITGETGAGKSILLGAIGLTLGQRADVSVLLDKDKKCVVEITYNVKEYALEGWFEQNELDYTESVIVRREIAADGKSRGFINDTPVNNKLLKEFGSFLIDIHSQHQSLLLGRPEYQIDMLDAFCGNKEYLEVYQEKFNRRKQCLTELAFLKEAALTADKEKDYLSFQLAQLDEAQLKKGEQEELEEELSLLSHAETIKSVLGRMTYDLRDTELAVITVLKNSKNSLAALKENVKDVHSYEKRLESVIIELKDLAEEAEHKAEDVEYNPRRIEAIQERLNVIYELTLKYKVEGVEELLQVREDIVGKLDGIQGYSDKIKLLEEELSGLEREMSMLADKIHDLRVCCRQQLCDCMKSMLVDLGVRHAEFVVSIEDTGEYTFTGKDDVKFLFAANKNQQPGEISKVASGGEISRVMLSLKYILSRTKHLPVIILDEIDTGLSGEVAHRMAQMMREMASRMQVVSISHLPQIAAAGGCHLKVYKEDDLHHTISRIKKLDDEERIKEIAGMISGSEITTSAVETAKNLLGL